MRLNLERARPAVADVNDSRVLPRPLQYTLAVGRQSLQVYARRFIRAVLAPHHAENAEFGERRLASAKQLLDPLVFVECYAVVAQNFGSDCRGRQSAHVGKFYFLISKRYVNRSNSGALHRSLIAQRLWSK